MSSTAKIDSHKTSRLTPSTACRLQFLRIGMTGTGALGVLVMFFEGFLPGVPKGVPTVGALIITNTSFFFGGGGPFFYSLCNGAPKTLF